MIKKTLKEQFLQQFDLTEKQITAVGLTWTDLENIHRDYLKERPGLEQTATLISNTLMKVWRVHSVRFRTKDPLHLLEKIVRKRIENSKRVITVDNYKTEITDLIGVRAIHLFKTEWKVLNREIKKTWDLSETPIAYYRSGDDKSFIEEYTQEGLDAKVHKYNYRSLHYIIKSTPTKTTYYAEIQVRTIFEEGWSEIDHSIRYPYNVNNNIYNEFLSILNRFAGGADEMGTFIKNLDLYLDQQTEKLDEEKNLQQKQLKQLISKVNSTDIAKDKKQEIIDEIEKLTTSKKLAPQNDVIFDTLLNIMTHGMYGMIGKL